MKQLIIVFFVILFSINLFAQDSTGRDVQLNVPTPPSNLTAQSDSINQARESNRISAAPTAQELADLFISACGGEMNPLDAVDLVAAKGENAVAGLTELLFSKTNYSTRPKPADLPDSLLIAPNRIFPVLALEKICTPGAIAALIRAAESHHNSEIRSVALNAIAKTYHNKIQKEDITPDKKIIQLLMRNTEDSTYIGYLQKTTGQIAEEGLSQWIDQDYVETQFSETKEKAIKANKKEQAEKMNAVEYRKQWLKENEGKLVWNGEKKRFSINEK